MRKIIRQHLLPFARNIRGDRQLTRIFGRLLHDPNLWHLNRHSVAWGVSVGLFMAFVPVPFQMVLAVAAGVLVGANLPVAVVFVWVSNPITVAPMFYAAYRFGAWMLDEHPRRIQFEMSIQWLLTRLDDIWEPFLLGCFVLGLLSATVGHLAVRAIWRIHVIQSWRLRRERLVARVKARQMDNAQSAERIDSAGEAAQKTRR